MEPITKPVRIASGLDIVPALQGCKWLAWSFIPVDKTFDWGRMHCVIDYPACGQSYFNLLMPLLRRMERAPRLVRATILFPGGEIPLHSEPDTAAVLHVILKTNEHCRLSFADCDDFRMQEGEAWLVPSSLPHSGWNAGSEPRIHLVADFAK